MGLPALLVYTDAFAEALTRQAEVHGQPALRRATVPHPVQDKDAKRIRELARQAVAQILSKLTG
jgi:hypothetical protein